MFSNLNKPTFGTASTGTTFGLGASTTNTASPWGNTGNTQIFGKPATTGFGQQPTTSFGQPSTSTNSMFPFFPQASSSGFGSTTNNQSTFGSNMFGQQQPSTTNLFGSNTFGQQKTTGFGFGTQNQQQPNLFGQSAQPQNSLFQPSGTNTLFGSSNAFGSTTVGAGTTIKFNPVTGTDTMQKSGVTSTINTKHHCITCMKEYEGKSLEELRLEDYQANRKGPQSQFGTAPFGSTASMFGQTTDNKTTFGQSTGFGQIGGTAFGQQTQPTFGLGTQPTSSTNIFAKPSAFGATSTPSNGFGSFNTNVTNTFGANQPKPFGTPSTAPLFGSTQTQQQSTPFGTSLFGQNNQNTTGGFFNKPAQTSTFGTGGFGFNQTPATTTTNLFQPSKPVFGLGQATSTGAFGQTPSFGQQTQSAFGTTFGKPLTFGQDQSTFQNVGQTSLFSNTQQKPGSLLGGSGGGIFGSSSFGNVTNTAFGLNQPTMQPQITGFSLDANQDFKNLPLLASNQFGHSSFLAGLLPVDKPSSPTLYTTNPAEIKKMLENNKKVDETASNTKLKLKLGPPKTRRDNLFEEGNDEDINKFYKTSCKRLVLKKKQGDSKQSIFETNSIYNDLSEKNSENVLTSSTDITLTSKTNSPRLSEKEIDLTLRDNDNTSFEIKFVNKNFSMPNSGKLMTQKEIASDNNSIVETPNESQISLDNTISRTDIPKGLEEPLRKSVSNISIASSDTDTITIADPQAIRVSNEVIESESSEVLDSGPKKPSASGITLNRAEYYTLPPIEELNLLVSEDGRCLVKGFTVGRRGYGNVYFPDELDVRDLNLDEIVHFRYKEIHMYPDESKKPPVGEGLNRRAQVTLDRVYPRVKETKEIINDIDQVLAAKFPEQLVEISSKHGLKFVDYRPETGSWVFMVDHFSKYAFTESDEEDCELSISKQNGKIAVEKGSKILILDSKVLVPETKQSSESKIRTAAIVDNMDTDLASEYTDEGDQRNGDILHKSMTIDLEGHDEDFINPIYETTDQDIFYHSSHIQMMKAAFFSDSECASTVSSTEYVGGVFKADLLDDKPKIYSRRPPQRPRVWKVYVNIASRLDDSILLAKSRCYSDLGVFKGKAFKVGWSRGFRNYTVKFPVESDFDTSISLSLRTVTSINNSRAFKESIKESIQIAHECSDFTVDGNEKIPTFAIKRAKSYLRKCHKIFNKSTAQFIGKSEGLYNDVWSLCNAFWGVGRRSAPFVKQRLSSWLKSTVKGFAPTIQDLSNMSVEDKLDIIFNHLTCFNVKEAAEVSMNSDMPALSIIISQMNLSQKPKAHINQQLKTWYNNMSVDHISVEMMRIYLLLSGNLQNNSVNVSEYLDWKRSFGVHLWYLTSDASPLQSAIESYANAFSHGDVVPPQPFYDTENETSSYDILYEILQLYKNRAHRLVKVLNPETYTNIKTDYQLSWLLLLFFRSLNIGLIDDYEETLIHTSFSAQLEENDQWELAILPLLYLKDNSLKKNLLFGILNRHLTVEDNEKSKMIEAKLIEDFQIPHSWISVVKAEKVGEMAYDQ
ncbi:hypothetical protein WA026_004303 [Henosepilachna vigintioctopunctata]|uniref:Nuclear pore complex protein Nup98-Nup96 n=1 Tax=Henosepilachna vigintioctopunctata TaxID=420089 RepID=A0AAW1V045_9CUCU